MTVNVYRCRASWYVGRSLVYAGLFFIFSGVAIYLFAIFAMPLSITIAPVVGLVVWLASRAFPIFQDQLMQSAKKTMACPRCENGKLFMNNSDQHACSTCGLIISKRGNPIFP